MSALCAPLGGNPWSESHSLRKATHFEDISEIMGRMALERDMKLEEETVSEEKPRDQENLESMEKKMEEDRKKIAELEAKLAKARKMLHEKDIIMRMLETENKHLSSILDEQEACQHLKDMYESAPQKRTVQRKATQDVKMIRSLHGSNVAPIRIRMPDNPRLGWAVSRNGIVMHRIMVEFSANLNKLEGRKMMLKWSVLRRFSAFEKLVQDLRAAGLEQLPELPAKSWFRVDPRKRQAQLDTFLKQLLIVPGVLRINSFRKFINLTDEMASLLPGGSNRVGKKKRTRGRT